MFSPGINLVMTVIGFAVSTMFIVFVCTRLICARIQLSASRRSFPTASRSDLSVLERGLHGLEPVVVSSFPTKKFSDHCFTSGQDTQCTICLAEYQEKDMLRVLPYCGHAFHLACIDIWLKQHSTCPMCRVSLRDSPERRRALMQPAYSSAVRSVYTMESFSMDPYQSVHGGNVYSNADGAADNHTVESNLSARPGSEGSSVRETGSTAIDCSPKTEGKYMDSPSNS